MKHPWYIVNVDMIQGKDTSVDARIDRLSRDGKRLASKLEIALISDQSSKGNHRNKPR